MKITWLGTACLLIETDRCRLLFDPYLRSFSSLPAFPMERVAGVDAIFITHPHLDHFADLPVFLEHTHAPVYVCRRGLKIAEKQGFPMDALREIQPNQEICVSGVSIRAWQSSHCLYDPLVLHKTIHRALRPEHLKAALAIDAQNHRFHIDLLKDVLAYEVTAEGKTVMVLGSANCARGVEYPTGADLLVFPYQGHSRMPGYSLPFLARFQPKRVMLDHFDDAFPPISSAMDCNPFLKRAQKAYPEIPVFVPKERVVYEI